MTGVAARDVEPGTSWAFTDHRSMAEVLAAEERMKRLALDLVAAIDAGDVGRARAAWGDLAHAGRHAFGARLLGERGKNGRHESPEGGKASGGTKAVPQAQRRCTGILAPQSGGPLGS